MDVPVLSSSSMRLTWSMYAVMAASRVMPCRFFHAIHRNTSSPPALPQHRRALGQASRLEIS